MIPVSLLYADPLVIWSLGVALAALVSFGAMYLIGRLDEWIAKKTTEVRR